MFHHSLLHDSQRGHVRGQLYMSLTSPAFIALRVLMRFDHIMRSCAVSSLLFVVALIRCRPIEYMYKSRAKRVVLVSGHLCRHVHRCLRCRPGVWPPLRSASFVIACFPSSKRQDGWRGRLPRIGSAMSAYLRGHRDMSCSPLSSSHASYHSLDLSVSLRLR
jgi:hypothetical protein